MKKFQKIDNIILKNKHGEKIYERFIFYLW